MTGVIRPAGPLPPRIYWVRRLLLLTVIAVILTVIWWLAGRVLGSASEPSVASSSGNGGESQGSGPAADPGSGRGNGGDQAGGPGGHSGPDKQGGHHQRRHHRPARAEPTGPCEASDVGMTVVVDDARSGATTPIKIELTSIGTPACTLAISPDKLVLRITSGADVIWSSDDCPYELLAREVIVRKHPATIYEFDWNGYRSTESCSAPGKVAQPGGYWAEAALVGADVHRGYFDIR